MSSTTSIEDFHLCTKLTGTGRPDTTERYPVSNGQVNGGRVAFELTTGEWKFFYDLKHSGLSGKLVLKSANDSRSAEVTLKRLNDRGC
jgi:hypothetical protein